MSTVFLIRPYGTDIRHRMMNLLQQAGLEVREPVELPKGMDDEEIVAKLQVSRPKVLIMPFHAHKDSEGHLVNGLDLAEKLLESLPHLHGVPIIMPVSTHAAAAASLRFTPHASQPVSDAVRKAVLLINEGDLDDLQLLESVRNHTAGKIS